MLVQTRVHSYVELLGNLKNRQDTAMTQQQCFPVYFTWPSELRHVVDLYKASQTPKKA